MPDDGIYEFTLKIAYCCFPPMAGFFIGGAITDAQWPLAVGGGFLGAIVMCFIVGMFSPQ